MFGDDNDRLRALQEKREAEAKLRVKETTAKTDA